MLAQQLLRRCCVARLQRAMTDFLESHRRALADADIVIDDQYAGHHIAPTFSAAAASGSTTRNNDPPPAASSAETAPPCHWATSDTSDRPNPSPCVPAAEDPRKKRSKILVRSLAAIPGPRSSTSTTASPSLRLTVIVTGAGVGEYLRAFPARLSTTRSINAASART